MSQYFARLAASHGGNGTANAPRAADVARPDAHAGDALPEVLSIAESTPLAAPALAPAPAATISIPAATPVSPPAPPAAPVVLPRPATSPPKPARMAAARSEETRSAAGSLTTPAPLTTHVVTDDSLTHTAIASTIATSPVQTSRADTPSAQSRPTPLRASAASVATEAVSTPRIAAAFEPPAGFTDIADLAGAAASTDAPSAVVAHTVSRTTSVTRTRATVPAALPRPFAPVIAPARESRVHIGRVELVVAAPAPPPPVRRAPPAPRGARPPATTRDAFSVHRHFLKVR